MRNWFLHNGFVYQNQQIVQGDVLVLDGKVVALGSEATALRKTYANSIYDFAADNCIISRGLIDLHVHLREPGFETKENIATGTKAAAAGGFTSIYAMPNTDPTMDSLERLKRFEQLVAQDAHVKVRPIAALTMDRAGQQLYDYSSLVKAGVRFFSDDGDPIGKSLVQAAMEKLVACDGVLINHLEDKALVGTGYFHEDIPPESEYLMLKRDLELVAQTKCRYHAAHLSCAESVTLIAEAKKQGLPVTAEVTPHQLTLTFEDIDFPEGNFQMKPPLRTQEDRLALIEGVRNGTIDIIATDHAPHGTEKEGGLKPGLPFGVTGLETAFAVLYTELVLTRQLPLERLIEALTTSPAKITGEFSDLIEGCDADLAIIDLKQVRTVNPKKFFSMGTNSPFIGKYFCGWPVLTLVNGKEKYRTNDR